eukprot:TRINITY_DN357_c0_g1_i1.p1 TRINITY_DN357_c0_g1~~TRINITY_DN357_c0_g1_i1.p1  ORF type:complete len:495 (-),score=78.68 TRINITY_DN357_c0_g1_i1:341-1708(-)
MKGIRIVIGVILSSVIVLAFSTPSSLAYPSPEELEAGEDFVVIEDDTSAATEDNLDGFNRYSRQGFSSSSQEGSFEQACLTRNGRLGRCTSLKVCYPYFKSPLSDKDSAWVRGLYDTCTYIGEKSQQVVGVCCTGEQKLPPGASPTGGRPTQPPRPPGPSPNETHSLKDSEKDDFELHEGDKTEEGDEVRTTQPGDNPNPKFNTGSCGARFFNNNLKIVNGEDASINEFPFMAALLNRDRHFCGGSLIDSKHILTAAHCVAHMTKSDVRHLRVHLGEHDIRSDYEIGNVKMRVQRIIRHKRFSASTLHNDVAILTLREPVYYSDAIQPICLATDNSVKYEGDTVTVAGWGTIREGGRQARVIQKVDVSVWRNSVCAASYGSRAPGGIEPHMLCASRQGKDSCSGDSGGPLFICQGSCTQIGIVSWGIGCAREEFPGVYTRVTALHSWIEKIRLNH